MKKVILSIIILLIIGGLYFMYKAFNKDMEPEQDNQENEQEVQQEVKQEEPKTELEIETLVQGEGESIVNGQTAKVHYTGTFEDGSIFDSSVGKEPFSFILGASQVIRGWDLGILGMKVGEKRKLIIPPELAYGEQGYPGAIPPNSTLTFEVELLDIE